MTSLHDYLKNLKNAVDNDATDPNTNRLVRKVLDSVNTDGDHGVMWDTARESLIFVLDVAVNQGTAEDLRELRENLDSGGEYDAQPTIDQSEALAGLLYRYNYSPDETPDFGDTPMDDIIDAWNAEVGRNAVGAVLAYVEEHWDGDEDGE